MILINDAVENANTVVGSLYFSCLAVMMFLIDGIIELIYDSCVDTLIPFDVDDCSNSDIRTDLFHSPIFGVDVSSVLISYFHSHNPSDSRENANRLSNISPLCVIIEEYSLIINLNLRPTPFPVNGDVRYGS